MPRMEVAGRSIVLLRTAQKMTQEEMAFQAHLSVSRLQDIEHGCANPTLDTMIYIARALRVDARAIGTFLKPDQEILSAVRSKRHPLPEREDGELQICQNVALLRKARGLTQAQLARISGLSTACLRDVEHGYANTTISTLACIADAFQISLLELTALTMSEERLLRLVNHARAIARSSPVWDTEPEGTMDWDMLWHPLKVGGLSK